MPKSRQEKETVLQNLIASLKNAKGAALTVFTGLKVSPDRAFRHELYRQGIEYSVVKKTLLRKAFQELNYPSEGVEKIQGNISIATSNQDAVAPAKTLDTFIKDNQTVSFIGGILESQWIDASRVKALAQLPGREELIARTVGTIKAPLSGFVNVMAGNLRGLVNVLKAIQENK
ncbi:MAG TPA: 50S ribosomal protein L10 [bacterium]|nr:50S ribosomal protein L10 [bacterium]